MSGGELLIEPAKKPRGIFGVGVAIGIGIGS
jgi:hypothetical protein